MVATKAQIDLNRDYTIDEWLALEGMTGEKIEYFKGKLRIMAGASSNHNRILRNLLRYLENAFEAENKTQFEALGSDQRVFLPAYDFYVYPDAVVVAEGLRFAPNQKTEALINPLLIFEVLSPSTENYDRNQKFLQYRSLPSFKEYVLVRQDAPEVLSFMKRDATLWEEKMVKGLEHSVRFESVDVSLKMTEIYRKVEF